MFNVEQLGCVRDGRVLFHALNFSLNSGEILHVQGPNGVGKSSLLRMLCGLLEPAAGIITFNGQTIDEDRALFTTNVGYLGHKLGLKAQLTAAENVHLFAQTHVEPLALLQKLGIEGLHQQRVATLSAGQQQRVALARLLARNTLLWLLDEPFTAIDQEGRGELERVILEHVQEGGMVIFTSHQDIALLGATIRTIQL